MITVTYYNILYDDDLYFAESESGEIRVSVEGHALFNNNESVDSESVNSKKGHNIICAAVSFSALTLLRSITIIAGIEPGYTIKDGLLDIRLNMRSVNDEKKNIIRVLIESFMIGMLDLSNKYNEMITIHTVVETK